MFLVTGCRNRAFSTPKLSIGSALVAHGLLSGRAVSALAECTRSVGFDSNRDPFYIFFFFSPFSQHKSESGARCT